jgi:ketosteroid isomerase-like protein
MSEENLARLGAAYREWAKGNLEVGEALYAEDATFIPMGEGRAVLDRGGFRRFMQSFLSEWEGFTMEALDMVDLGDKVLVTERQRARGHGSGIEIDQVFYAVWSFRDGFVVRVRWDSDLAEAREAAGLSG